jgi:hypothetical protein
MVKGLSNRGPAPSSPAPFCTSCGKIHCANTANGPSFSRPLSRFVSGFTKSIQFPLNKTTFVSMMQKLVFLPDDDLSFKRTLLSVGRKPLRIARAECLSANAGLDRVSAEIRFNSDLGGVVCEWEGDIRRDCPTGRTRIYSVFSSRVVGL